MHHFSRETISVSLFNDTSDEEILRRGSYFSSSDSIDSRGRKEGHCVHHKRGGGPLCKRKVALSVWDLKCLQVDSIFRRFVPCRPYSLSFESRVALERLGHYLPLLLVCVGDLSLLKRKPWPLRCIQLDW